MHCNICKKQKATVHLTEIINDEVTELHLCEECAKAKDNEMQQHFSIVDLLSGLVDFPADGALKKENITLKCQTCGMKYSDFKKMGRFGCSDCYEVFKRALYPLLKKIHGTSVHIGKKPNKMPAPKKASASTKSTKKDTSSKKEPKKKKTDELQELKNLLQIAIDREEFEDAAILRDKIKALEKKKS